MSTPYKNVNDLKVADDLLSFVNNELLKDTGIDPKKFWNGFNLAVHNLAPINKKLIEKREELQKKLDEWHKKNIGSKIDLNEYKNFLKKLNQKFNSKI